MCLPKPVQDPYPPIMIGGTGQKVLLKIVAKHADMWNATNSAEEMGALIEVIRRHGDAVGRDTGEIENTVMMPLCYNASRERQEFVCNLIVHMRATSPSGARTITPELARKEIIIGDKQECLDTIERYAKVGVTHFIFMCFAPYFVDEIQAFAEEVIPAAR